MSDSGATGVSRAGIEPVFLLGIAHRSGTNYLAELLDHHAAIAASPLPEDFLVAKLPFLEEYVRRVRGEWSARWDTDNAVTAVRAALGRGLQDYLVSAAAPGTCRILARTPSVDGLPELRRYFPNAWVILLIRDGRSVVESGIRSFEWNFDDASRRWARAARTLEEFRSKDPVPERTTLVRYEQLVAKPAETLESLLSFLSLDPADYPFQQIAQTGVIGSSELKTGGGALHWEQAEISGFNPLERFSDWTAARHKRFNWLAGRELSQLGYEPVHRDEGFRNATAQRLHSAALACRPRALRRRIRRLLRGGGSTAQAIDKKPEAR